MHATTRHHSSSKLEWNGENGLENGDVGSIEMVSGRRRRRRAGFVFSCEGTKRKIEMAGERARMCNTANRRKGWIDDPSTVAPVPRTEIVTCPLCRRDPNAHAYRPRSSSDERTDKRVPWRGSSGELSSTRRVYTARACECPQVKHTRTRGVSPA